MRQAVEAGQRVEYAVTPLYEGANPMPAQLHVRARGTPAGGGEGLDIDVVIDNRPATVELPGLPPLADEAGPP